MVGKETLLPGMHRQTASGQYNVFENHIFLAICRLIYSHWHIDFCTPGYFMYALYDRYSASLYFIPRYFNFFPQSSPGYTCFYRFDNASDDILLRHHEVGRDTYIMRLNLTLAFPMYLLPFRAKALVSNFDVFSFAVVLVVLLVVLKPWLHVPDQITPALNSIMWMGHAIFYNGSSACFCTPVYRTAAEVEELETMHLKEINEFKDGFLQILPMNSVHP